MFIEGGSVRFDLTFFGFHEVNFPLTEQNIDNLLAEIKKQMLNPYDYGTSQEHVNYYRLYRISGSVDYFERKKKIQNEG